MRKDEQNICKIYSKKTVERYKKMRKKAFFNERLVNPKFRQIILSQNIANKKILDIGCGYGADLEYLLRHGARDLTGTDISKHFLNEIKNNKQLSLSVKTYKRSIYSLNLSLKYDIAISNMVLDQVKNLNRAFKEVSQVLNQNGLFIFSIMHPLNTATRDYKETFINYFKKETKIIHPKTLDQDLFVYQRTLEDFSSTLTRNGFIIRSLHEPRPTKRSIKMPQVYDKLPGALIICAQLI